MPYGKMEVDYPVDMDAYVEEMPTCKSCYDTQCSRYNGKRTGIRGIKVKCETCSTWLENFLSFWWLHTHLFVLYRRDVSNLEMRSRLAGGESEIELPRFVHRCACKTCVMCLNELGHDLPKVGKSSERKQIHCLAIYYLYFLTNTHSLCLLLIAILEDPNPVHHR
jgi:hypothetical protein